MEENMKYSENPSAVRSRSEITEALLELMKREKYSEITVSQIVLEARLARKTFYRNFTSKDDVLDNYMSGILREYVAEIMENGADVLSVIFGFCRKNRDFILLMQKNDMMHVLLKKLNVFIAQAHDAENPEKNLFAKLFGNVPPDYPMAFNIGGVWNVICLWAERGIEEPPEVIIGELSEYFSNIARSMPNKSVIRRIYFT